MLDNNDQLEKQLWEQEKQRSKNKRAKMWKRILIALSLIIWTTVCVVVGFGINTFGSIKFENNEITKMEQIKGILENQWYFKNNYENLGDVLLDEALYGMTSFDEDPYTSYMSKEEIESFQTSINKGFVGIGVTFLDNNGNFIITKVFNDSPAKKAGVIEGDIIVGVDGVDITNMSSNEIGDMVKGEAGTIVVIDVLRAGSVETIAIERGQVVNNTYGFMVDENTAYVQLFSFGQTTASELAKYMNEFKAEGANQIIIDLRDNGGGYLDALVDVASLFLPKDELVMIEEFSDGSVKNWYTKDGKIEGYNEVVLLVNENSASASEVLTMALKEKMDNVTVVGQTTYGKGTVQNTRYLTDGSAIKYTVGRWLSPNGVWIQTDGIVPDVIVEEPAIISTLVPRFEDDQVIELDSVSLAVASVQVALDYLGYDATRSDGYFDENTLAAINQFEKANNLNISSNLNSTTYKALISLSQRLWATDISYDPQLTQAIEVING